MCNFDATFTRPWLFAVLGQARNATFYGQEDPVKKPAKVDQIESVRRDWRSKHPRAEPGSVVPVHVLKPRREGQGARGKLLIPECTVNP